MNTSGQTCIQVKILGYQEVCIQEDIWDTYMPGCMHASYIQKVQKDQLMKDTENGVKKICKKSHATYIQKYMHAYRMQNDNIRLLKVNRQTNVFKDSFREVQVCVKIILCVVELTHTQWVIPISKPA